mmetsp:Transcript_1173/g.1782  ORF Transcript_1173/g.1782 Transcript_1173/m.1782 type:complete len:381 (+) Transcript_1173:51-1193(+)
MAETPSRVSRSGSTTVRSSVSSKSGRNSYFATKVELGEGHCSKLGKLYQGTRKTDSREVMMLMYDTRNQDFIDHADVKREVQILKQLNHRHIINYESDYRDSDYHYLVYAPVATTESLFQDPEIARDQTLCFRDYIGINFQSWSDAQVSLLMIQVLSICKYLHEKRICHRHLTPDVFMITEDGHLKLVHFSFATPIPKQQGDVYNIFIRKRMPKNIWNAPEVHNGKQYTAKLDMWAAGLILWSMLHNRFDPFTKANGEQDTEALKEAALDFSEGFLPPKSANLADIAASVKSVGDAITKSVQKSWHGLQGKSYSSGKDLCCKLVQKDPRDRLSAREALRHEWLDETRPDEMSAEKLSQEHYIRLPQPADAPAGNACCMLL